MVVLAFVLAVQAAGPPPPQRYVLVPSWRQTPSEAELAAVQPRDAAGAPLAGRAVISCTVAAEGALADCVIASEKPPEGEFGKAALALADRFVMRGGEEGATVRIPFTWEAPAKVAATPQAPAGDAAEEPAEAAPAP
jgi:protein TonB